MTSTRAVSEETVPIPQYSLDETSHTVSAKQPFPPHYQVSLSSLFSGNI